MGGDFNPLPTFLSAVPPASATTIGDMSEFLTTAVEAALMAGKLLRENFEQPLEVDEMQDHDIKLELDRRTQELIENHILARHPDHAILGEEGSTAVAHHILKMGNKDHDATLASVGATTYSSFCLACHGPTGQGNSLLGAPNLVDDNWLYGNTIEDIATTVNKGRSNQMPAHGELLGDEKTQILAHYVKSLSQ